ncbi:MAG: hypothetical protein JW757_06945 [Anaerolineales bacterium]|nr:hypothetical protein [Anaerolineales bacterium]
MANIIEFIKQAFVPGEAEKPLPTGVFHYITPPDHPRNLRLHLRLESDGRGLLIVNASTVLHLNQTAAEFAYHIIRQTPKEDAARVVQKRYQVSYTDALRDFNQLQEQIDALIDTPDLDPVTYLNIERLSPYSDEISAPYRLDCALTYQVPPGASPDVAPTKRVDRELTTQEWQQIIAKAWQAGIPHLIFTGGEPTLRDDLPELISFAEEQGQVTGLLTDGLKLGDSNTLQALLNAGLDHTMIVLHPEDEKNWKSLANFSYWAETMKEDLYVAVHLTMTTQNKDEFETLIHKLAAAGISALSLSAADPSLAPDLEKAQQSAYDHHLDLVWDIPVPYSQINPISLELAKDAADSTEVVNGAGIGWLYVEPDGDVLPGQGIDHVLGNLLTDQWSDIWKAVKDWRR